MSSTHSFASLPSSSAVSTRPTEQKLRHFQLNFGPGRTEEELAHAGVYFASSGSPFLPLTCSAHGNAFSTYVDSAHPPPSDTSHQSRLNDESISYLPTRYHNEYIPYDYQQSHSSSRRNPSLCLPTVLSPRQSLFLFSVERRDIDRSLPLSGYPLTDSSLNSLTSRGNEREEAHAWISPSSSSNFYSPSSDSLLIEQVTAGQEKSAINDNEMKTEFVNFRKKQFETGYVENLLHDNDKESKTKKYSEKKKYETEWNRLTAVADVESVMERASHFEDIDPDKFARVKSRLPTSPGQSPENFVFQDDDPHEPGQYQSPYFDRQASNLMDPLKAAGIRTTPVFCKYWLTTS